MYFLKKTFESITKNIRKSLNKDFPNPGILDKDESVPGKFVQNTPEINKHIVDAQAAKIVLDGDLDEYLPKEENANQIFPDEKEKEIAEAWRAEKANRGPLSPTKEEWAKAKYEISAKQVRRYEIKHPPE